MSEVQDSVTEPIAMPRLTALVASRICHDLVGPLGAIANGLELMALTGESSAEAHLIAQSVASATARLRYFRIAYGLCGPDQMTSRAEITSILQAIANGGRLSYDWEPPGGCRREEVRSVFLLIQCMESAMPAGGLIRVCNDGSIWTVSGDGPGMRLDEAAWLSLRLEDASPPKAPALVQFALLPALLKDLGRSLVLSLSSDQIVARF